MAIASAEIRICAGGVALDGTLSLPPAPTGLVAFVHGSGSSRFSPRNRAVAGVLQQAGLATLLFDLLTAAEERLDRLGGQLRFDIDLLAARTIRAIDWLACQPSLAPLPLGLFGASTGAAAALRAAADRPDRIAAVVSRGGRPDLALADLPRVAAPTLLIVGARDTEVLVLNRQAAARMHGLHALTVVPGASHLFEEPGCLAAAAAAARDWFLRHLVPAA